MHVIDATRAPVGLTRTVALSAVLACGCLGPFNFDRELVASAPVVSSTGPEPVAANAVRLQLGARYFLSGEPIKAELHVGTRKLRNEQLFIAVQSTVVGDVELVPLRRVSTNSEWYVTEPKIAVVEYAGHNTAGNAQLELRAGEQFTACFLPPPNYAGFEDLTGQMVCASEPATLTSLTSTMPPVNPAIGLPVAMDAIKPSGTLLPRGSLPVQIATGELLAWMRNESELDAFLSQTGGVEAARFELSPAGGGDSAAFVARVKLEPSQQDAARLDGTLAFLGQEPIVASNWEVHSLVNRVLELRLAGWTVSVNPRLEPHGPPLTDPLETLSAPMLNGPSGCIPGAAKNPCVLNVEAAWAYMELWDQRTPVNVAVLDSGFATNGDFRAPGGDIHECALTESEEPRCEVGAAQGAASGASSPWHGTGVVQVLGGVLGNGEHAAGVAGQVAVPLLYRYGELSYGFELGAGLKHAADHGASVINLSAGYPCHALAGIGPDLDRCSQDGRAGVCRKVNERLVAAAAATCAAAPELGTTDATSFGIDQFCAAAAAERTFISPACTEAARFDNAHSPLREGMRFAAQRGVPVVVSAGNKPGPGTLPEAVLEELRPEDWQRVEQAQMLPALYPEPIVVSAADADTLDNLELFGDRVDVWAPVGSRWFAPERDDVSAPVVEQPLPFGGSSAAAPFVSGTIALMQAVNPELNPRSALYTDAVPPERDPRRDIVSRLKGLLSADAHGWSNAELVALGRSDQPEQRRHLIDPLALVRAASEPVLPETAQGYDPSLGYSELLGPDDTANAATPLTFDVEQTGTILSMFPDADRKNLQDVDWYRFSMPQDAKRPLETSITIAYPAGYGNILAELPGGGAANAQEGSLTLQATGDAGRNFSFFVTSPRGEDNAYSVRIDPPRPAIPQLTIVSPTTEDRFVVCGGRAVELRATAAFVQAPELGVAAQSVTWSTTGTPRSALGLSTRAVFEPGQHKVQVTAYQDPATTDELVVEARACLPPTVRIDTPPPVAGAPVVIEATGLDLQERYFARVTLSGSAADQEDGTLGGTSLRWTSTRVDIQPAVEELLGTGNTLEAIFYGSLCDDGATYDVRLTATDSDGNSTSTTVRILVYVDVIC